jgi:hypothetical protein
MHSIHSELAPPVAGCKLSRPAVAAGLALLLIGAGFALGTERSASMAVDPCALPAGAQIRDLDSHDASLVTRRLLACSDLHNDRISVDAYRQTIAAIDKEWSTPPAPPPASIVWASTVRGFSSQYSPTSWSAHQALGAPNVFPGSGDNVSAWASLGADDRDEWLEVGFDQPRAISGVEIFETYNPGAVERVELITQSGRVIETQVAAIAPGLASAKRTASVQCTSEPIVAVRVHVASVEVAGWNEIDAIGVVPCTR